LCRSLSLGTHDVLGDIPASDLDREHLGMNVGGIPFSGNPNGFWVIAGLIAAVFAAVALVLFQFRSRLF